MNPIEIAQQLLKPCEYVENIFSIDLNSLQYNGIKLLLIDITNTLMPATAQAPSIRVIHWFEELKKCGFEIALLSNSLNTIRIEKIAKLLNVEAYYFVCKPLTFIVRDIIEKDFKLNLNEAVLIGDQLLGDVALGNWLGAYTILVKECDQPLHTNNGIGLLRQAKGMIMDSFINKHG